MTGTEAQIVFAVAVVIGVVVAAQDLRTMTIPNWMSGAAAAILLALMLYIHGPEDAAWRLAGAAIVLVVGFLLFAAGQVGGGDAKAAAAFSIAVAPVDISFVLIALAFCGLLGVAALTALRRTPLASGSWKVWSAPRTFPYGLTLSMTLILYTGLVVFLMY